MQRQSTGVDATRWPLFFSENTTTFECWWRRMRLRELVFCLLFIGAARTEKQLSTNQDKSCGQVISSDTEKHGTITSPNYPEPYPPHVDCSYQFMGHGKERVQISFTDFDLHLPNEPPIYCESVDAVMIFITITGQKHRVDNFCGNKLPKQIMSTGPSMIVEFRSIHSSPEVKGFRAIYRFVTDFGIRGGVQDQTFVCSFTFNSKERRNGTFTSPNYPGFYPKDTECHYFFFGQTKERVHITFAHFDVDGVPPCKSDTVSDYVELSNFKSVDRKIPRHCGDQKPKVIESDGDFFRVTFKSNDRFDRTGFEAFYQFKNIEDPLTVKRVSTTIPSNSSGDALRVNLGVLILGSLLLALNLL